MQPFVPQSRADELVFPELHWNSMTVADRKLIQEQGVGAYLKTRVTRYESYLTWMTVILVFICIVLLMQATWTNEHRLVPGLVCMLLIYAAGLYPPRRALVNLQHLQRKHEILSATEVLLHLQEPATRLSA